VATKDVDAACRAVITDAGWADQFTHGTGHGVGLDIHELPRVSSRSDEVLEVGMIATVEPGVYLPGLAGVRWEDSVLVTESGGVRLTRHPKEPVVA
jgi:Xaa-Pro aminopeptidase